MYLHSDACRYTIVRSKDLDTVSNHVQVPWTSLLNSSLEYISSITYNMPIRILWFFSTCSRANLQNQKPKGEEYENSEISSSFCSPAWLRRGNHWQRGLRLFHALPSLSLQPDVVCFGAAAWHTWEFAVSSNL